MKKEEKIGKGKDTSKSRLRWSEEARWKGRRWEKRNAE